jgi:hypothetical protein
MLVARTADDFPRWSAEAPLSHCFVRVVRSTRRLTPMISVSSAIDGSPTRPRFRARYWSLKVRGGIGHTWSAAARLARRRLGALIEQLETRQMLSAMVTTDKPAYAPTDTAQISGSGFGPSETIDLQVVNETTGVTYAQWTATDDADGNFASTWSVPIDSPGDQYQLTATGETLGDTANASFAGLTTYVYALPTDYPPGASANIFAGGFQVGETVDFQVDNLTNGNQYLPPWAVTDGGTGDLDGVADGKISTTWLVPDDAANSTLQVTATGESSGLSVQNTFTDGTVTAATGGSAISADTNTTNGTTTWTSLTGPVYTESALGNVGTGTIILNAPTGFVFDTGGVAPTVQLTGGPTAARNINGLASGSTIPVSVTSTTLTITITSSSNSGAGSANNKLTWQNIRVRPTSGSPLASGNITSSGTATVNGVTNGTTNWGTLTEVPGAVTQLTFNQQPTTTSGLTAISPAVTVQLKDQFGNVATNDSTHTVSMAIGTNPSGGTLGGTTTVTAASGVATFNNLTIDQAGTGYTLQAATNAPGASGSTSSAFTITPAQLYWDANGGGPGTGGNGTWNTTTQEWRVGSTTGTLTTWVSGADAFFPTTAGTVTVGSGISVDDIEFDVTGYTLTASTLTFVSGGGGVNVTTGTATVNSVLAGSAGLSKIGTGTLVLGGVNIYSGTTTD